MKKPGATAKFQPADGMAFHILGEQGLLFSEMRQELHMLDASASYVWCCVRDGVPFGDIASAYAEDCEIPLPRAERIVGDLLHRWLGLGYIQGDPVPSASPIDLTAALGRLLVNPALRAAFAADPRATAVRLRLRDGDIPLFVRIDPAQLEQAVALADEQQANESTAPSSALSEAVVGSAIRRHRTRPWSAPPAKRFYRLGGTTLRIGFDTPDQEARIHCALGHLETGPVTPDIGVDLIAEKQGHVVLSDGQPVGYCDRLDRLARTLLVPIRDIVIEREDYFLLIHAGLASNGEACILLPAAPGSGKSTLTAALARAGFRFFTDEIAMLDGGTMAARPFPFPVVVKEGSMDALRPWYPDLAELPVALRDNDQPVRYLPLDRSSLPDDGACRQPVKWIVFPRYDKAADTALRPLRPEQALAALLRECRIVKAKLDRANVAGLVGWLGGVACYDLTLSSLSEAVALLQGLCDARKRADDRQD